MNHQLSFTDPCHLQKWSIPDSIIYYMIKNPSNAKVYQKMKNSCKYFFAKNSIIVLSCLHYTKDGWKTCSFITEKCQFKENEMRKIDLENISSKLWILDVFDLCQDQTLSPPSIISKLYKSEIESCRLLRQTISLDQLLFLASTAKYCLFYQCTVIDENDDGSILQLEKIVANLPQLKALAVEFSLNVPNISSKTIKELLKIPHFSNIEKFALFKTPEVLDLDTLFEYVKDTSDLLLLLQFSNSISDAYKKRIDSLIDKILEIQSPSYRTPWLAYRGQNQIKRKILLEKAFKKNFFKFLL